MQKLVSPDWKLSASIDGFRVQGRRFRQLYGGLLRELWESQRNLLCLSAAAGGIAAVSQGLSILVLVHAVQVMDPERSARSILPESWPLGVLLGVSSVVLLVIGAFSAWISWRSVVWSRRVGRRYQQSMTEEMLEGLARIPAQDLGEIPRDFVKNPALPFVQGALISGVAAETLLLTAQPLSMVTVFALSLVVLDWRFFLLAIPLILIPLPALLLLNRQTHKVSSRFYGTERTKATAELVALFRQANEGSLEDPGNALEQFRSSKPIQDSLDDYDFFKIATRKGEYITNFVRSILATLGLLIFGYAAIQGWLSWSVMIAGLLAIIRLQQGASSLFGSVTKLVRFAPVISRTRMYRDSLKGGSGQKADQGEAEQVDPEELRDGPREKGSICLVVTGFPLLKTSIPSLQRLLRRAEEPPGAECSSWICPSLERPSTAANDKENAWEALARSLEPSSSQSHGSLVVAAAPNANWVEEDGQRLANLGRPILLVASRWAGDVDGFDRVYRISQDEQLEEGSPSDWAGRLEELRQTETVGGRGADGMEALL
ncbi:MAG: hypothetical protein WD342_01280 [Verrucomicrobiales bacterium]